MMMGGMMSGGTSDTSTTSSSSEETRQLEIEEVLVSVGQRVEEGASIVRLNAESVAAIRASLEEDANSAKITYDQVATDNQLTVLSAEQELETNQIYGSYSQTEYDSSMKQLQDAVDTAQEDLETAKEELVTLQEEAATLQSNVAAYQKLYDNAVFTVENTDKETALYWWVVAENAREDAETMLEDLEDSITQNTEDTTAKETEIEELERTNEIGILKAIGCSRKDILMEFLLEAACISFVGAIIGVLAALGITPIIQSFSVRVELSVAGAVLSLVFGVLTGSVFGFYPAYKASRLIPVVALNQE